MRHTGNPGKPRGRDGPYVAMEAKRKTAFVHFFDVQTKELIDEPSHENNIDTHSLSRDSGTDDYNSKQAIEAVLLIPGNLSRFSWGLSTQEQDRNLIHLIKLQTDRRIIYGINVLVIR